MKGNSATYADFTIIRIFKSPVHKVYQMFADKQAKELWFGGPSDRASNDHTLDFVVGGSEFNSGKFHDGVTHVFKAHYYDIIPEKRIVYSYEMYLDDKRISVSLSTIEFIAEGDNTKLTLHESGVFLDNLDKPENRERGTKELLNALENALIKKG